MSQEEPNLQQEFIKWQALHLAKLPIVQQEALRMLSMVSYLHPPLYYGEQAALILKAPVINQYLGGGLYVPYGKYSNAINNVLRLTVLSNLIYQGDYLTLAHLPVLYGCSKLMTCLTSGATGAGSKIALFYLGNY